MQELDKTEADWKHVRGDLERIIGQSLDEYNAHILQTFPLSMLGDELLWQVEALHTQVPAPPAALTFWPIRQSALTEEAGRCGLCGEATSNTFRCDACVFAVSLVLGQPILLQEHAPSAQTEGKQAETASFFV